MNESIKKVSRFLKIRKRGMIRDRLFRVTITHFSIILLIFAVTSLLFSLFPWTTLPLIWVALSFLISLSFAIQALLIFLKPPALKDVAKFLELKKAHAHPLLSIALELSAQPHEDSKHLRAQIFSGASEQLPFFESVSVKKTTPQHIYRLFFLIASVLIIQFLLPYTLAEYWKLPLTMLSRSTDFRVEPGSIRVAKNSSVTLRLSGTEGRFPSAGLKLSPVQSAKESHQLLRPDQGGEFSLFLDSLKESVIYQFSLGRINVAAETLYVAGPPQLRTLQVTLTPPAYTNRSKIVLPSGQGNFSAYEGSVAHFRIQSDGLHSASLIFENDSLALEVSNSEALGDLTVTAQGRYSFSLTDSLGQISDSLVHYKIAIIPDEAPLAFILKPAMNKNLSPAQVETLLVEGIDDIGIREMGLEWCRSGECNEPPQRWVLSEKGEPPVIRKQLIWNIREVSLYPGDTLFYWLRVRDNKPRGAQVAISDTFWFRIPTIQERHKEITKQDQYTEDKLGEVREQQNNLSDMVEQLMRSAGKNDDLSWEQQRILEDVKKQLQSQTDTLQQALESLQQSIEQLREQGALDESLTKKMEEVRKAIEEMIKEFGEDLFFDKDGGEEKLSWQEMKEALEKVQEMLPELSERLDQTLQFLEMLKREKEISMLASTAENLSKEQAELSSGEPDSKTAERQNDILDAVESFQEQMSEQFSSDQQSMPCTESMCQMGEQMRNSLKKGELPSEEMMNAMSRELMSVSSELNEMLSSSMAAQMEKDYNTLLNMVQDALTLSDWQRTLQREGAFNRDDPKIALGQQALKNALNRSATKSDTLQMIPPRMIHQINRIYRDVGDAIDAVISSLPYSDGSAAMNSSISSLDGLANAILGLLNALDESQGESQGGGGMMAGMRKLSGRQAALNSAMGDMLQSLLGKDCPGGSSTQPGEGEGGSEELEAAREAAREAQNAIAEELRRLADQYGKKEGESIEKRIRELEQEARRLAALMNSPPPDMLALQDRFLSRMLQSTLSVHKRDEDKEERKGNRSESLYNDQLIPPPGDFINNPDSYHIIRRKAMEDNYPEEYRQSIRSYFDSLGEIFLKQ